MSPVYDFRSPTGSPGGAAMPQLPNHPDLTKQPDIIQDPINKTNDTVSKTILTPSFSTMDRGILNYFSNIIIPVRDDTKKLEVRLAGGDRSILIWKQDLESGRIKLPVMSINRISVTRNENKFSPPYVPVYRKMADSDGTRMILTYREWPCIIEYQLSVWTERRQDLEYATYQILTRFNPMAEWAVDDMYLSGFVQAKLSSTTYSSDVEAQADKQPFHRVDIGVSVEGWLPLPLYRITPTVLGKVGTINEEDGTVLETFTNNQPGNI